MSNALLSSAGIEFYLFLIQFALFILQVISLWFLFKKANVAGWKSIIPIYNIYKMYQIVWETKFFGLEFALLIVRNVILYLIKNVFVTGAFSMVLSAVQIILLLLVCVIDFFLCRHIAFSYGKSTGFAVGLFFLYPIFILILALGNSRFVGKR
ncbi:MAG: hypothetical protein ACI4XI_03525 [Ruminococcus sp.]